MILCLIAKKLFMKPHNISTVKEMQYKAHIKSTLKQIHSKDPAFIYPVNLLKLVKNIKQLW